MNERRVLQRFAMRLPVLISVAQENGRKDIGSETVNICSRGACIEVIEPFPVGTRLRIDVFLENAHPGSKGSLIRTSGIVIRTGPSRLVVQFDERYQLISLDDQKMTKGTV